MAAVFFSASWQWDDLCFLCPDKNAALSFSWREPAVDRAAPNCFGRSLHPRADDVLRTGRYAVGGDCQGISLGWLSGNSFSIERVPREVWRAERLHRNRQAGRRPARQKGGAAAHLRSRQGTTDPHPPAAASAKRLEGAERPRLREAGRRLQKIPLASRGILGERI